MNIEVALLISVVSVCFSVYFGLKNNKRSDAEEISSRIAENIRLNVKLDEIARNIVEIKEDIRLQKKEVQGLAERMARVEESAKQAHHRLDRIEEREDNKHENE